MKLTEFTQEDIPILQRWMNDEKLMYYMLTEKSESMFPSISFAIRSNGKLVGWANLFNIDFDNEKAECGIAIPEQHNIRLGGFAMIEILKYAFCQLKLNRVYLRPLASNVKENDQRQRFGFTIEGIERQAVKRGYEYEDVIVMSILRKEFEGRWLKCQR